MTLESKHYEAVKRDDSCEGCADSVYLEREQDDVTFTFSSLVRAGCQTVKIPFSIKGLSAGTLEYSFILPFINQEGNCSKLAGTTAFTHNTLFPAAFRTHNLG